MNGNHEFRKAFSTHAILEGINSINAYRRITLFSRQAWISFWSIAHQLNWLDEHQRLFGITIHRDVLDLPNDFYASFGVVIYLLRLCIHLSIAIYDIFFAKDERSISTRFYSACKQKHWYVIGDVVSATISLLTGFPSSFHLAAPFTSYLVIALLVFTFLKLVYFYTIEKQRYDEHKQYLIQLRLTQDKAHHATITLLKEQLAKQRAVMQWRLGISIAASLFLLIGFAISVTYAPHVFLPLFLYMSVIGAVVYLSAENFGQFMFERKAYLTDRRPEKYAKMMEKWHTFIYTALKNLVIPTLLIGLFAIHWPTALALTVLYIGIEGYYARRYKLNISNGIPETIALKYSPQQTYAVFFKQIKEASEPSVASLKTLSSPIPDLINGS